MELKTVAAIAIFILHSLLLISPAGAQTSLVPPTPSAAPDYYCTWNLQGYVCSYQNGSGSNDLRVEINEDNLFGAQYDYAVWGRGTRKTVGNGNGEGAKNSWTVDPKYQDWLAHYPMIHQDLIFVMDDSWDIPKGKQDKDGFCSKYGSSKRPGGTNYDNPCLARVALDETRFPSFTKSDATGNQLGDMQRLRKLVDAVKARGWRSLGGWICAQDPIMFTKEYTGKDNTLSNSKQWSESEEELYWKKRLAESDRAGFSYWKVDWGNKDRNEQFRRNLSKWGREVAPNVVIEHASFQDGGTHHPAYITFSETIRSYDVNNNIAQAQTLQRLYDLGKQADTEREGWGIINCEDEPYIAAGLGCAIGVMRHPYVGSMPNGKPDTYFADYGDGSRRLKNRLNEIVRAVRWHRIALPFTHKHDQWYADSKTLQESGNGKTWDAPARISRRLPLPVISGSDAHLDKQPYVLASLYDNDCAALAIVNRNIDGVYQSQRVDVSFQPLRWDRKVGIFGYCHSVTINYQQGLPDKPFKVYAQDLASDDAPTTIAFTRTADGRGITIDGSVLENLCKGHDYPYSEVQREAGKDYTDLSDPAVVLLLMTDEQTASTNNIKHRTNTDSRFYDLAGQLLSHPAKLNSNQEI